MVRGRLPPTLYTRPFRPVDPKDGPRLWNAKRRIKTSTGLTPEQFQDFKKTPPLVWFNKYTKMQAEKSKSQDEAESPPPLLSEERAAIEGHTTGEGELEWWKLDREHLDRFMDLHPQLRHVSDDVRTFISHNSQSFQASTILQLLQSPVRYFSASSNVPLPSRQQVYLWVFPSTNRPLTRMSLADRICSPDTKDAVVLMRTPHLGPRYAAFDVPRHFSKLDLRAYLKNIYNVDVLHIRSVVVQEKVTRKDPTSPYSQGALFRPPSKKKMTVQLVKPFVYPEEFKDLQG